MEILLSDIYSQTFIQPDIFVSVINYKADSSHALQSWSINPVNYMINLIKSPLLVNGQPQINRQNMHKGLFGVDLLLPFIVEITVCAILHYCALSLYYVMF